MIVLDFFTLENFPILIVLGGAALLYFGKVIGDTKVEKYDKLSYYIEGLLFSVTYLFIPLIFSIWIVNNLFRIPIGLSISIQIVVLSCLFFVAIAHYLFRKYGLVEWFKKKIKEELNEFSKKSWAKWWIEKENWFKSKFGIDYTELILLVLYEIPVKYLGNKYSLFLQSFLTILSLVSLYFDKADTLILTISSIITFFLLTFIALDYGFSDAYYPPAKVYLDNGEIVEGNILKFGEFIYLINKDKKFFINNSKVIKIEENLWKNKEVK